MKPSALRHPVAVLRNICGLYQKEFAELIGCSRIYLQKIEQTPQHYGQRLSEKLAQRIFHETGISLAWLLNGDPSAPPISANGEPYTRETFQRNQAHKIFYDRPNPFFFRNDALGFCARLIAILESAAKRREYFMAAYKVDAALKSLRREFGKDEEAYPTDGIYPKKALELLRLLVKHSEKDLQRIVSRMAKPKSKRSSLRRRRARA